MSNKKHKRNRAYAPKKPAYTPMTKEQKIRYGVIILAVIVVIAGLALWNKYAPWDGSLPVDGDHNLTHTYSNRLIVNMDNSSIVSHRKYFDIGGINGTVEGYTNDEESTIRSDKNTTDFLVRPDEGTDSPFMYYYISASNKNIDELTGSVYETMSNMYPGYITDLLDGTFGGREAKYFTYLYDASHDEVEETEDTENADAAAAEETQDLAESAVVYLPGYKDTTIVIQTPVDVQNDPANFVDEQVMLDLIEKIIPTIDFKD